MSRALCIIISVILSQVIAHNAASSQDNIYRDVSAVNGSDSLLRILSVPIKTYEFKYDSMSGRKQIGVLGSDAQRWFPEAVDIVPTYTVPNKDRKLPALTVKDFPIVDKTVIYTHGVIALKELINRYDTLQGRVERLKTEHDESDHLALFAEIERRLSTEAEEQTREKALLASANVELTRKSLELEKMKAEADTSSMSAELEGERSVLFHQEQAAIARMQREEDMERLRLEGALRMEGELAESRERLKRETSERLQIRKSELAADLETQKSALEEKKIRAEIEARAEQERANQDITLEKLRAQAEVDSNLMVKRVETVFFHVNKFVGELLADPSKLAYFLGIILGGITAYFVVREVASALREIVMSRLGRPSLVRETSVKWSLIPAFIVNIWKYIGFGNESLSDGYSFISKCFSDVILSHADRERVMQVALTTRNTKASGSPYRHVLLHGPPGTGKTLIARRLAETSGMDFAIMSGGDIGPLGEDAVPQLHHLFRWASSARHGLLIFIDESEAFLSARDGGMSGSDSQRHALNALLYQTGTESTTFMLVLATNRPEDLDAAVLDRMDVSIRIGLPESPQRSLLLSQYLCLNVINALDNQGSFLTLRKLLRRLFGATTPSSVIHPDCMSDKIIDRVAHDTDGFSGREISKLMIAMRYAVSLVQLDTMRSVDDLQFRPQDMFDVVAIKVAEHKEKTQFMHR